MGLVFLMFLHFVEYSLGCPLHNQIDSSGSTHLLIGKSFQQRDLKWQRRKILCQVKLLWSESIRSQHQSTSKILGPMPAMERKIQRTIPTLHYRCSYCKWLISTFRIIGALSAILICGDLIEAGILPMPDAHEWGGLIVIV